MKACRPNTEFPKFLFARRRDIELEAGFLLAGRLVVDMPKTTKPGGRRGRVVHNIIQSIYKLSQSGEMPDDAMVAGWRNGRKPENAADIHDDALMAAWSRTRLIVDLRFDPRPEHDGLRIDSDLLRQMGLMPNTTGRA